MAFYSGFFNSKGLDRTYTAEDFTSYLSSIICNGILDTYGQNFKLTAANSGLGVVLGAGKAWINGHYFINDSRYVIDLTSYQDESLWECAGIFYDFGITGTKADVRDGLQALLYECRIGRIDYVLTKSVSRFSRNTTDCLELVSELLSYKVPIYFEKEKLDTGSMETELVLAILSSLAQEESESISKNVKWGNQKRIKNGRYRAGTAPYGYTFDSDGNYTIIPEEADVVRFIFESVVSGMGVHKIGKELDSQGV